MAPRISRLGSASTGTHSPIFALTRAWQGRSQIALNVEIIVCSQECNLLANCRAESSKRHKEARTSFAIRPVTIEKSEIFILIIVKAATSFADRPNGSYRKSLWRESLQRLSALRSDFVDGMLS